MLAATAALAVACLRASAADVARHEKGTAVPPAAAAEAGAEAADDVEHSGCEGDDGAAQRHGDVEAGQKCGDRGSGGQHRRGRPCVLFAQVGGLRRVAWQKYGGDWGPVSVSAATSVEGA
ncbi:unnamed protein product [Phaeothamnion confervicola]